MKTQEDKLRQKYPSVNVTDDREARSKLKNTLPISAVINGLAYSYTIRKVLGQGAFGITYLATVKMKGALGSLDTEITVAIKEFFMKGLNGREDSAVTASSKDGTFAYYKRKFLHEAENLSRLKHPNIIKVVESFEENNTAYYAMEYVDGGSLDDMIVQNNGLMEADCLKYAIQIATALEYMHSQKMLHLDLKPNNIMLHKNGEIILIDFGLAKQFDENGKPETSTTIGHGTPGYAPLEQSSYKGDANGEFPATMDIYAFGATMYKMLTGHRAPDASTILNEGFPYSELWNKGVHETMVEIVAKCMEPLRRNRYASATAVIEVLNTLEIGENHSAREKLPQGYYKKKQGEREYGTFYIEEVPVTSSIDFPETIDIKLWDNSKQGKSYQVIMTDGHFADGYYSRVRVWDKGELVDEHEFQAGIPEDVKEFIISHGFLSTEHWENECETSPFGEDFGTDASITMVSADGKRFERRVRWAHAAYHNLLLDELNDLLTTTSLAKQANFRGIEKFTVPSDTVEIIVTYHPSIIGGPRRNYEDLSFYYTINELSICRDEYISKQKFMALLKEIEDLGIEIGIEIGDTHDYSEDPGELIIRFKSRDNQTKRLSLKAFNTDMIAGNIYNANIIELSAALQEIIFKYFSKEQDSTPYSIPNETGEILIEYSPWGIVGMTKSYKFGIGRVSSFTMPSDYYYVYNSEEFGDLVQGLNELKLNSQEIQIAEPPTGETFAKLTITCKDIDGVEIMKIYAEDDYDKCVGNIAITTENLKNELIKISPSFKKMIDGYENNESESQSTFSKMKNWWSKKTKK